MKLFLWMNFDNMDEIELEIDLKGKINTYERNWWHKQNIPHGWNWCTKEPYHTWMKLHMEKDDEQNYKNVVQVSGLSGQLG